VQQKISRTLLPVVDGKGSCYCHMLRSRESTACKFFGKRISRLSPITHARNSHCGVALYWKLERKQRRRKEVGVERVMGLIRDFAVDLGIWKEGRGQTWWAEIV